ncbi:MAG: anaerobic sulfatase maturase [bacterium]|nr:anaerobic sulfatase maturase [bacterium]
MPRYHPELAFHIIAKPVGPLCNLACRYCFYLEKHNLFPATEQYRMSDVVLETYIKQYIQSQDVPEIHFSWQGGEPTLLGIEFYQKVIRLQQKYANGKKITNSFQTNGILLNDAWAEFLAQHHFLIGLSIDGPQEYHDCYRVNNQQQPTFDRVMLGLEILKKHQVEFNTLTCVHKKNMRSAKVIYQFLKNIGANYQQYIPIVERKSNGIGQGAERSQPLASPPDLVHPEKSMQVTKWSVEPREFGRFLIDIFDLWVEQDIGEVFVQYFDNALSNWLGLRSPLCVFAPECGKTVVIEHNGMLYSCDHYVYPKFALGNILEHQLNELVYSEKQQQFGKNKSALLPEYCQQCEVRFACNGGCPKHRFLQTPAGQPGLNYLCQGLKLFFEHIRPYMEIMRQLVYAGRPASAIRELIAQQKKLERSKKMKPNDLCFCGSGKKYKKCCGMLDAGY